MDFHHRDMRDSRFGFVDLDGSVFRDTSLGRVTMRGVEIWDADISGDLRNVVINGVDVVPLIEAELDRRDPDRPKMRPTDPAGFREAWDVVERLWAGTVERARELPPSLLHESVADEWSFIETLRHMMFVTDAWVRRPILGDPSPWHPLSLPWDGMPDTPGVPRDRSARPALDEVLALRHKRMATVRQVVDSLTDESLASETVPVEGPGWPPARAYPVRKCLLIVLNEEWHHRLFAERDLDALFAR